MKSLENWSSFEELQRKLRSKQARPYGQRGSCFQNGAGAPNQARACLTLGLKILKEAECRRDLGAA